MKVVLLGTAAGGGFPRWNCACARCSAARDGKLPARTQECAAVSGNSRDWWLLNASPDIRTQLNATPALAPGPGGTPVRGVLLTDAEAHHVTGLAGLYGAPGLKIYASPPVLTALSPLRPLLERHAPWTWEDSFTEGGSVLAGGLVVSARALGSRAPGHVPGAADDRWVTAYRIEDLASGGVLVYAPRLGEWTPALDELITGAACVLLGGTLYAAGETDIPVRAAPRGRRASWHLPVSGADGSLAALARHPGPRVVYTHFDSANPLLDPATDAYASVTAAGAEIPLDGAEFVL
ncbi:pyrroloquinoline quinone biosynthesis protein PqqB [Streptomyces populi]|uniref:Coenzyme PQQ synthesis protein B n=1 Tax=Streptomyces populi TaxID=2058924 RepID=A0A2I0SF76_9ACTN|nr:MBL fold metallo-hydrolase [Streptomyces populi]PKT68570.1 pyrroloquinoline quinone biosynthesis protein PqqB [Streptomyces populi]